MNRRRLTRRFPWLIPLRTWQRKKRFYLAMALDGNRYCRTRSPQRLPRLTVPGRRLDAALPQRRSNGRGKR